MAPTTSQPRRKRSTAGTNKLVGGKTPNFRPNDSNSSSDDLIQEVVMKPSTQSKIVSTKPAPKKKKTPPVTPPPVAVTPASLPSSNSSSSSSSSSAAAASSSSSASTSSSESVVTSVEESDGGWSSAHNDFSSNHEDDFDDDAEPMVVPPPPLPVKRKTKAPTVVKKKEKSVAPLKQKTNVDKKKKVPRQAETIIDKKSADDTGNIVLSEDIDDSILRGSSDHSMDLHSFSEVASQQQHYIVVEEPQMSYHYDGVHLEEDVSDSQSLHDNNIPSSVAINVDNGHQQQQMNNSGTNPLFDVSDPSMDDSISKNYDSRYDGSLQDLTYNHGKSNGSINNFSGGSWNLKNENKKNNSNSNGDHDDDNDDGSDSSSEMNELTGYLSSGDLHNPNALLQPFVGERPPTPPSPMRSMNGKQQKGKTSSSLIKSATAKAVTSPSKDLSRITETSHDDLVGVIDLKDESTASESAPPSHRNTQFDNFYPTEYGTHDDGDIGNASDDKLMDTSVQPSCKYNNDEEVGKMGNTRRFNTGDDNEKYKESTITPKDDDREKKQHRTIRLLFVALACACLALLAMGVVVGLLMKNDKEPVVAITTTPSPAAIVSAPTPTQSVTTSPSVAPSIVFGVTTAAPTFPQVALPTNAPILRNSTASFPFAAPTNAPIQRNSTASLPFPAPAALQVPTAAPILRNTSASVVNAPVAAPTAVGAPVVLTSTVSPTTDSIALP